MNRPLAPASSRRALERSSPDKMYKSLPKVQLRSSDFEEALDPQRAEIERLETQLVAFQTKLYV